MPLNKETKPNRKINKETVGLGNKRMSRDHPNNYIIENGQNTEKSPADLRRHAFTQTSMKANANVKTSERVNKNNDLQIGEIALVMI